MGVSDKKNDSTVHEGSAMAVMHKVGLVTGQRKAPGSDCSVQTGPLDETNATWKEA